MHKELLILADSQAAGTRFGTSKTQYDDSVAMPNISRLFAISHEEFLAASAPCKSAARAKSRSRFS